ncbi:lipid droplet-regulating VLDL assembly factor AUP1 isoform X4 [Onychostruthus taczanowskii]|uniref:lipid droplet-regulating VLDL assembly factor AUP1 isoform X4 n=1 Tax=Onychostruthus taczanowskii TaxID=356909 RepID=UPI001B80668F|nr:lipid droplet-regulating VLDL assembly factor AUP1 isoform X4 [Onychostruthus taczanowskii]
MRRQPARQRSRAALLPERLTEPAGATEGRDRGESAAAARCGPGRRCAPSVPRAGRARGRGQDGGGCGAAVRRRHGGDGTARGAGPRAALRLVPPALSGAPGFICWSRGFMELGVTGSRAELVDSLKEYTAHRGNPPLLLFPEEAATNGRAGLLRFSSWPFSILDEVQPVALQVRRPLVAVSVADSSWITELLWTFFVPFTVYQVRWMPSVPRRADERSEDFALRVQELLAVELGVVSTRITAADRTEHMKRLRHTAQRLPFAPASSQRPAARPRLPPSLPGGAPEDVRVVAMAQQVKEVLPHVPLEVIRTDLVQTNCVDTTIANLLEGRVQFFPESKEPGDLPAPSTSQAAAASGIQGSVAAPSSKPATKQFAKSPVERHLSLQERKRALYDYARRRFAEKHGVARAGGSP